MNSACEAVGSLEDYFSSNSSYSAWRAALTLEAAIKAATNEGPLAFTLNCEGVGDCDDPRASLSELTVSDIWDTISPYCLAESDMRRECHWIRVRGQVTCELCRRGRNQERTLRVRLYVANPALNLGCNLSLDSI
jgi:hypothetical protein